MNIELTNVRIHLKLIVFSIMIIVVMLFGSPSFNSPRWILQNFRIFSVDSIWTEYMLCIFILILCSIILTFLLNFMGKKSQFSLVNNNFLLMVPFILSTTLALYYFKIHNLFNLNLIITDDYPIHHYLGWLVINVLIPNFQSIFGFSFHFWGGYPVFEFYPPGFYLIMALFNSLHIPIQATIRLFQFLILILLPTVPFLFCRYMRYSLTSSITASLWLFYCAIWLKFLIFGLVPFLLAVLLSTFFLMLFIRVTNENKFRDFNYLFASTFLNSLICITHYTVSILMATVMFLFIIYCRKWKTIKESRDAFFFVFVVNFFTILSSTFMLIPMLTSYLNKIYISQTYKLSLTTSVEALTQGLGEIFYYNIIWGLLFIPLTGVIFALINRRQEETLLILALAVSSLFSVVGFCTINTPLQDLWFPRFLVYFEIFSSIFVGRFFDDLSKFMKRINQKSHANKKKALFKKIWVDFFYCFLLFTLLFASINATFSHVKNPFPRFIYTDTLYSIEFAENEDHTMLDENVKKVIRWIEQNAPEHSRIMIEDSGSYGFHFWGGHILALLPILTNRTFIGGYQPIYWYAWSNFATCREGEAFGVKFQNMNFTYFVSNLKYFNIQYLILWSNEAKKFVNSFPSDFDKITSFGSINIYNFTKAPTSWYWTNSSTATVKIVCFAPEKILIKIYNASERDVFRLAIFRHPNYEVYLNNTKVNFLQSDPMMSFFVSKNGDFDVSIKWTKTLIENISTLISILTWMFLLGLFISINVRRFRVKIRKSV